MTTTNPRITITISKRQHEVLRSISDTTGKPMSTFVTEMLDASLPTLERMAVAFQKIKQAQDAQRMRFVAELDEAQTAIEPVVQNVVGQFDMFMEQVEKAAEAATASARAEHVGAAAAAAFAPATNRGATPTMAEPRKARPDAALRPISPSKKSSKKKG